MGFTPRVLIGLESIKDVCPCPIVGELLTLRGEEAHHLRNVLRCSIGDRVEALFPKSEVCYLLEIEEFATQSVLLKIVAVLDQTQQVALHLLVGKIRQKAAEDLVRWCCELGTKSITFYRADYSQFTYSPQTITRLEKISRSAAKQAKTPYLCSVAALANLRAALEQNISGAAQRLFPALRLFLASSAEARQADQQVLNVTTFFTAASSYSQKPLENSRPDLEQSKKSVETYIVIGPEGGFSAKECALLKEFSFVPCSLGPNVLRSETAALVVCALGHSML